MAECTRRESGRVLKDRGWGQQIGLEEATCKLNGN